MFLLKQITAAIKSSQGHINKTSLFSLFAFIQSVLQFSINSQIIIATLGLFVVFLYDIVTHRVKNVFWFQCKVYIETRMKWYTCTSVDTNFDIITIVTYTKQLDHLSPQCH